MLFYDQTYWGRIILYNITTIISIPPVHYKFANKNNENQAIGERKKFDWLNPATRGLLHYEKASE